jgi:maltooligosyltrehalose trehalohydrolase
MSDWNPTLGALSSSRGTTFRVWAPERLSVEVVYEMAGSSAVVLEPADVGFAFRRPMMGHLKVAPTIESGVGAIDSDVGVIESTVGAAFRRPTIRRLVQDANGYWSATFTDIPSGALYKYRLDGSDDLVFPDPASRYQPFGVHGPSQVIDPAFFRWTDASWVPRSLDEAIFYELHIGTFTPEGTFRAAIERLPYLTRLGVTAIEIMPVGDFPGERNWGYDGVAIFAPARCYGTPDDLRALVDAAHAHGLAVYLDVVYNHFGPDGAYANVFSPYYFSNAHSSPWGAGVNLDRPHSAAVRRFFIENALHWVGEYHIDGLRLDATHALVDDGATHFLAELTATVREHVDRPVTFVAEDHRNLSHMLQPVDRGGWGIDAVWADDFHHQMRVHAAGDRESYFSDYSGAVHDLVTTLRQGWFFTGQPSSHVGSMRGTDPSAIAPQQFVICIQNHDQIGNRADGARLHHQIAPDVYRALSALFLFAPQTPLLFMGQEWAATTPFLFFTDHHDELGRKVTEGRREEFRSFAAFSDPLDRARIPDPQTADTFERSRLAWDELDRPPHDGVRQWYERLIALRRVLAPARRGTYNVDQIDDHTIAVRRFDRRGRPVLLVARISGSSAEIPVPLDTPSDVLLTTEDVAVDGTPRSRLRFARPGAIIFGSSLAS